MRITLAELTDKLGVGYVPGAYETCPWSHYDVDEGITCSAEIRMGADSDEVEGEIQMMYDEPPEDKSPMEQICYLRAAPMSDGQWTVKTLKIMGAPLEEEVYDWEGKSCNFFAAVVRTLIREELPDIDELLEAELFTKERLADQRKGGGGKSPKMRGAQVMGVKGGGSF
jgi:hypothetical protein